ncbi:intracellular protein transport protein USO1-like [Nicotiana sylvestris]|uniref:intracellular protein transport protein USO1-like n=1 Tax=Nicotiana sylvestris TaxID=4096 RepID=UPI00388C6A1E
MDELIGNLKTYEIKIKKDGERREPKKEKNLVLKAESSDSSDEDSDMAYLTKRFQKMVRKNSGIPKRGSSSKERNNDLFHRHRKSGHFIKDCPLMKQEQYKQNPDKAAKRNLSDEDEEDEDDEVNFRDVQRNLKSYSSKKLCLLANVLIDAYYSLDNDKEILSLELGEAEQSRDNIVVCVVDLNETIANLEKEKEALNKNITSVENERDDLMVVVFDLKETIEGLSNEKHTLEEKYSATEQERYDFLVIITDLEETIEGLNREHRTVSLGKGKEVASETHIKLKHELNDVKTSVYGELDKNQQLQAELEKERNVSSEKGKGTFSVLEKLENLSVTHKNVEQSRVLVKECTVTNLVTGKVVLVAKRNKNIYVANFESLQAGVMRYLRKTWFVICQKDPSEDKLEVQQSKKTQKSVDKSSDESIEKQNGASVKGSNKSKKSQVEQAMSEYDIVGLVSWKGKSVEGSRKQKRETVRELGALRTMPSDSGLW